MGGHDGPEYAGVQLLTVRQAVACFCLIALASSVAYTN